MIQVWADSEPAGRLERVKRGTAFGYLPDLASRLAVSMTMPVRLQSYNVPVGLHPIFEMNLPEGVLRERLRLTFAKAIGTFDDYDLLSLVGRSQMGRLRYTAVGAALDEEVPFQSVDEILERRRDGDLFRYLMERFESYSGISGVQPKVLIRDESDTSAFANATERKLAHFRGATHIVKFWDPGEYPELAANEYFCMRAAALCELDTPRVRLVEDGSALVVDRFDLRPDGTYRGLEDFCVLNGYGTSDKYRGGYETALFRRMKEFVAPVDLAAWREDVRRLFTLFVLNCAIRNGDAHLKNFALIYDRVDSAARLAPVYDLVTTTAYLPRDQMALTLNGTARWPSAKQLLELGTTRCSLSPKEGKDIFERIADGMSAAAREMRSYASEHAGFRDIADRIEAAWAEGVEASLGFEPKAWLSKVGCEPTAGAHRPRDSCWTL